MGWPTFGIFSLAGNRGKEAPPAIVDTDATACQWFSYVDAMSRKPDYPRAEVEAYVQGNAEASRLVRAAYDKYALIHGPYVEGKKIERYIILAPFDTDIIIMIHGMGGMDETISRNLAREVEARSPEARQQADMIKTEVAARWFARASVNKINVGRDRDLALVTQQDILNKIATSEGAITVVRQEYNMQGRDSTRTAYPPSMRFGDEAEALINELRAVIASNVKTADTVTPEPEPPSRVMTKAN